MTRGLGSFALYHIVLQYSFHSKVGSTFSTFSFFFLLFFFYMDRRGEERIGEDRIGFATLGRLW